jgi:hypothetical protein
MIRFQDIIIDRSKRTIARNDIVVHFSPIYFRLVCALILDQPRFKTALFDLLYDDREDGGPDSGAEIISVMLTQAKPKLARLGLELRWDGAHARRRYWAEPISLSEASEAAE